MFVPKTGHDGDRFSQPGLVARRIVLAPPLRALLNDSAGAHASISRLLTHQAVAVTRGTSVESVTTFMLQMGLTTLPVVDSAGQLLGVVSTRDLLGEARDHRDAVEQAAQLEASEREELKDELDDGFHGTCLSSASIGDVMTESTLALSDKTSIAIAAETMTQEGATELPVVCAHCGGFCIVSALDLLAGLAPGTGAPH